jgi:hypothetical protein
VSGGVHAQNSYLRSFLIAVLFGREDEVIVEMQEALKKSQGGILEGRTIDHLIINYNQDEIVHHERKVDNAMVRFLVNGPKKNVRLLSWPHC